MAPIRSLAEAAIRPAPDFGRLLTVLHWHGKPDRVPAYELFAHY
jgi:hypothetical protein